MNKYDEKETLTNLNKLLKEIIKLLNCEKNYNDINSTLLFNTYNDYNSKYKQIYLKLSDLSITNPIEVILLANQTLKTLDKDVAELNKGVENTCTIDEIRQAYVDQLTLIINNFLAQNFISSICQINENSGNTLNQEFNNSITKVHSFKNYCDINEKIIRNLDKQIFDNFQSKNKTSIYFDIQMLSVPKDILASEYIQYIQRYTTDFDNVFHRCVNDAIKNRKILDQKKNAII